VTSLDGEGLDCGLTLNSVASVSLDPQMMLICLDNNAGTLLGVKSSGVFSINILARDQQDLAERFAQKDNDKFGATKVGRGETGVALISGALVAFECSVEGIYPGGDHQIIVGSVLNIHQSDFSAKPLMYIDGKYS